MKLTQKQISFAQDVFGEVKQGQAYMTHYKVKSMAVADVCASQLIRKPKIQAYLQELRDKVEDKAIMDKKEILKKHSTIGRAAITDFQTAGADGSYIDIGSENKHTGAIQELTSRTEYDKDGSGPAVITRLKLHDPVRSMQEIAKLRGYYPKEGIGEGITINIEQAIIAAGNRLEGALKRLSERVSPEAVESKSDSLMGDNDV